MKINKNKIGDLYALKPPRDKKDYYIDVETQIKNSMQLRRRILDFFNFQSGIEFVILEETIKNKIKMDNNINAKPKERYNF